MRIEKKFLFKEGKKINQMLSNRKMYDQSEKHSIFKENIQSGNSKGHMLILIRLCYNK